jgi:hypothetical protein
MCPSWNLCVASDLDDASRPHLKEQARLDRSRLRIGWSAVVEELQAGELREQPDQVVAAAVVPRPDLLFRNVVTTGGDACPNALYVQIGTLQGDVPDMDLEATVRGLHEEPRDGVAAEGRLEGEVRLRVDRTPEASSSRATSSGLK